MRNVHYDLGDFDGFYWSICSIFAWEFFQCVQDILTAHKLAENCVFLIKMGGSLKCNIELRSAKDRIIRPCAE